MNLLHRVLLVEHTEIERYLTTRMLRKVWPDVDVIEARDGEGALERLGELRRRGERTPDLILLDIDLPRLDGRGFLETWYDEAGLEVPAVVMLTSTGRSADRSRAVRSDGDGHRVVKPVDRATAERLPEMLGRAA